MGEDLPKNKILKYLILTLIIASFALLIKEVILKPETLKLPSIYLKPSQINVDFDFLESEEIEELAPFEKISLPEEIGRENPFSSY